MVRSRAFLKSLVPHLPPVTNAERFRASIGAVIGILVTGFVTHWALGPSTSLPLLIAPMGASSVLLFAVPASPLAQPWSIVGGNLVSAFVGVTAALLLPEPFVAAAFAAGFAILAMLFLRCLHPPSGAVALTAVLGGPVVQDAGYSFLLWPVGVNSLLLLAVAVIFNNLSGRSYPHRAIAPQAVDHGTKDPSPSERVGFTSADIDAVLEEYDQLLPVDPDDLEGILRQAQLRAYRRRTDEFTSAEIMSRDFRAVAPDASLRDALLLLRKHHIKALPVVEKNGGVVGIVTQTDLLDKVAWGADGPRLGPLERIRRVLGLDTPPKASVSEIMTSQVRSVFPETPIADLVPLMANGGLHFVPVIDPQARLVGVITQSDLIAALFTDRADPANQPATAKAS